MVGKNQIKLIASLHQKKYRHRHGLFIAEGQKVIAELLDAGFPCEWLYQTENIFRAPEAQMVTADELRKISALVTANNCLAVFKIPDAKPLPADGLVVALDDVRDPGNLGTIIRLADWFGVDHIICSAESADVYNPKCIQATMGSIARVSVTYTDLTVFLSNSALPAFGTFMDGTSIYEEKLPANAIVVFGNEANGISEAVEKLVSRRIAIPRFGKLQKTESLNVAAAVSIVLSEFRR